jgi:hypothetical protein
MRLAFTTFMYLRLSNYQFHVVDEAGIYQFHVVDEADIYQFHVVDEVDIYQFHVVDEAVAVLPGVLFIAVQGHRLNILRG